MKAKGTLTFSQCKSSVAHTRRLLFLTTKLSALNSIMVGRLSVDSYGFWLILLITINQAAGSIRAERVKHAFNSWVGGSFRKINGTIRRIFEIRPAVVLDAVLKDRAASNDRLQDKLRQSIRSEQRERYGPLRICSVSHRKLKRN